MNNDNFTGYRIYEKELEQHEKIALKAIINETIEDDMDAHFPSLALRQSLSDFVPC